MTTSKILFGLAAAGLLSLSACDRGGPEAEAAREQPETTAAADVPSPDAGDASTSEREGEGERRASADERPDPRKQPIPVHEDGSPVWAANRTRTAMEAAERQFARNGDDFGASTVDAYIDKAHAFVGDPPKGTLRHTRSNGDKLFYDPKGNVFAVATSAGAPRTMFKPDDGMAYWEKQKQGRRNGRSTAE
jgi:pyocin large subunit-like protein